jgi:hypothetical protein
MVATAPKIDFDLQPVATDAMMKAGISEDVIKAMAARENGGVAALDEQQSPSANAQQRQKVSQVPTSGIQVSPVAAPPDRRSAPPVGSAISATSSRADPRTRIFIGETSEWQASSFNVARYAASYSAFSGVANAGAFGMSHAGLMKLTIPVMNQVNRHCPGVLIVNRPEAADLFVRLDQSTTMWARHDDMAVFNRAGEMVFVTSSHSVSKDAKRFCSTLMIR